MAYSGKRSSDHSGNSSTSRPLSSMGPAPQLEDLGDTRARFAGADQRSGVRYQQARP